MPGYDKTGPFGEGPMTGRRFGTCNGKRNFSFKPMCRGFRNGRFINHLNQNIKINNDSKLNEEEELQFLKTQSQLMQTELNEINKQITNLENKINYK